MRVRVHRQKVDTRGHSHAQAHCGHAHAHTHGDTRTRRASPSRREDTAGAGPSHL